MEENREIWLPCKNHLYGSQRVDTEYTGPLSIPAVKCGPNGGRFTQVLLYDVKFNQFTQNMEDYSKFHFISKFDYILINVNYKRLRNIIFVNIFNLDF